MFYTKPKSPVFLRRNVHTHTHLFALRVWPPLPPAVCSRSVFMSLRAPLKTKSSLTFTSTWPSLQYLWACIAACLCACARVCTVPKVSCDLTSTSVYVWENRQVDLFTHQLRLPQRTCFGLWTCTSVSLFFFLLRADTITFTSHLVLNLTPNRRTSLSLNKTL